MRRALLVVGLLLSSRLFAEVNLLWGDTWDDVFKGIKATSEVMNLFSQFNQLRSEYATTSRELNMMRGQLYAQRQEEWNRWNGLVSLLTQEQKQMVLKFNTMPDNELVRLWLIARKSTETFPAEWLMPTKYDSVSNSVYSYWTTYASADEYIDYAKGFTEEVKMNLWKNTNQNLKEEVRRILKERRRNYEINSYQEFATYHSFLPSGWNEYYSDYLKERPNGLKKRIEEEKELLEAQKVLDAIPKNSDERKQYWKNIGLNKKNEVRDFLNKRKKNHEIASYEEFELYLNLAHDSWNEKENKRWWENYLRKIKKMRK